MNKKMQKRKRTFFMENEIVLSTYFSVDWGSNGLLHSSNLINITSKIGLKCYVGINKIKKKEIIINNFSYLENGEVFEKRFYEINSRSEELEEYLVQQNLDILLKNGYEINIFSEIARGHGFGITGAVGSLIFSGFDYILNGNKSFETEKLLKKSQYFDFISKKGNSSGGSSYVSFIKNNNFHFLSTEKIKSSFSFEEFNKIKNNNFDINKKFEIDKNYDFPLDYFVVYSGLKTNTLQVNSYKETDKQKINNFSDFLKNNLDLENKKLNYNNIVKSNLYEDLDNMVGILNLKLFHSFYEIFTDGLNSEKINSFIENINNVQHITNIVGKGINFTNLFKQYFFNNKKYIDENIGVKALHSNKIGGSFLIVTRKGLSEKTILKSIDSIKKDFPDCYLEYSSTTINNIKNYGISLEQDIFKGNFSEFIDNNYAFIKDGKTNKIILLEEIKKIKSEIIIDSIKNKIFINGEKITSKEVQSQKMLTEIFLKLFNSKNFEIKNSILSASSYSANKSELSGKIVYPFIKIVEKKLNKNLKLSIGGQNNNFMIQYKPSNIKIIILEEIINEF